MFRVIPAIDIKNRKCVSLIQGIPGTERVSIDNPLDVALRWIKGGARIIHLIDLDGAIEGNRLNSPIIESIIKHMAGLNNPLFQPLSLAGNLKN